MAWLSEAMIESALRSDRLLEELLDSVSDHDTHLRRRKGRQAEALRAVGEVIVCAPDRERSAASRSARSRGPASTVG